ncbi:integrase [Desulfosalsimonas propionicica]|uniref:Integrase n=1 Tax=Desulfosalsimonas propionicica TaxID=332175 RepID=A0A7W0HLI8_9BACT|nr:site-specific integrase [Desulfosalsimonas propionicica]MBA2882348.1 integrase [Desulfosalsimonas propionicica]
MQEIRAIYHKAIEWGLYSGPVPTDGAKKLFPKINNQRTGFLSPDQALDLLTQAKAKSFTLWCQCVLALHAGLRFGEIAALEWPDVNFNADTITIRNPKAGRDRAVYMNEAISDMFQELIAVRTKKGKSFTGLVFPDTKGRIQKHVSRSFYEVTKDMGLNEGVTDPKQRISFHSLRHTYGSQLAMQGYPIQLIQELMGHHSLEMTARYSHFSPGLRQEAAKSLANLFKEESGEQTSQGDVISMQENK